MDGHCRDQTEPPDSRGHQKPNNDLEHLKMMQRLRDTAWPRHMDDLAAGADVRKRWGSCLSGLNMRNLQVDQS